MIEFKPCSPPTPHHAAWREMMEHIQTFMQECMGIPWEPDPREVELREAVERYTRETEEFDRTVCTGPIVRGEIVPATGEERARCSRNALAVRERILREVGCSSQEFQQALRRCNMNRPTGRP
jgi:hypothetical protein